MTQEAKRFLLIALAVIIAGCGIGGGIVLFRRNDPVTRAEEYVATGDWRSAQILMRTAVLKTPNDPDIHLRMARLQMKVADPVAAEREFRRAVALGAAVPPLIPEVGEAILLQRRFDEVLKLVPQRGPSDEATGKNLLLRAIAQLSQDDTKAAEDTWAFARQAVPKRPETTLIAARIAAARNDIPATETSLEMVLKQEPGNVEALLMQGQLLTAKGDRAGALAVDNRAVAAAPWSALARIDRAYQLMFAGRDSEAKADVDAVLDIQPLYVDAVYLSGILMARRGDYADAAVQLSKLDGVGSRFPQAMYYQGLVAQALGQKETAADYAKRYNLAVPRDPEGLRLRGQTALAVQQGPQVLPLVEKAVADGLADPATLDLLGKLYLVTGNPTAATQALRRAVDAAPENAAILSNLGVAELREGDAAKALKVLESAAQQDAKSPLVWEAMAQAALRADSVEKAQAALDRLKALTGDTEAVGNLTGMVLMQQGNLEGARSAWAATIAKFPGSTNAAFNTARLLVTQGQTYDASQILRQILTRDPGNLQVLRLYIELIGADMSSAIAVLEAARMADPQQPILVAMLADANTKNKTPERGEALINQVRAAGMTGPVLVPALARALAAEGKVPQAEDAFREALALNPQDALSRLGLLSLMRPGPDNAAMEAVLRAGVAAQPGDLAQMSNLVEFTRVTHGMDAALALIAGLRADPANMPYAAALNGDLLMRLDKAAEAAVAYRTEFDASATLPLLMRMVAAQARAGQGDAASTALRSWLATNPDSADAARTLAQLDITAKRYKAAEEHLALVLRLRPSDPQALNNLAWTYFATGDKRARAAAQDAYLKAPSPATADTLGWIMVSEGMVKPALPLLTTASAQRPQDRTIRYHLAVALEADGQAERARTLLRELVASKDEFEEKEAARTLLAK